MKRILSAICLLLTTAALSAQTIVKPGVKTPTTFAIVIDKVSYEKARAAVDAYKQSIEADGLGTWLLIDDWRSPEPIRQLLQQYHADKKAPLEGCVLVGDIPIPMIRDGQYLTSAFKMNQKRDWKESRPAALLLLLPAPRLQASSLARHLLRPHQAPRARRCRQVCHAARLSE